MPPVVCNTTPLVALWALDQLPLLRDLFGDILIPPTVAAELLAAGLHLKPDLVAAVLKQASES